MLTNSIPLDSSLCCVILSSKADIDSEVNHRLSCASGAYARLRRRVFEDQDLSAQTKLLVYRAVVLPTLLYGAESWTTYSRHLRAMEQYHQRSLRKILRISWKNRHTNISILEEANKTSITTTIMQYQLWWTGHVIRMPNTRLPKQILYSQLKEGSRATGGQKKCYKDNSKAIWRNSILLCATGTQLHWTEIRARMVHANHEIELRRAAEIKRQLARRKKKGFTIINNYHSLLSTLHQSMRIADWPLKPSEVPQVDPKERTVILVSSDRWWWCVCSIYNVCKMKPNSVIAVM